MWIVVGKAYAIICVVGCGVFRLCYSCYVVFENSSVMIDLKS